MATRVEQLNKLIEKVSNEGFTYPTEYAYLQNSYARLISPTTGKIRTIAEANDYLKKRYGDNAIEYTEKQYNKDLSSVLDALGERTSYRGFVASVKQDYLDVLEDAGIHIISNISASRLVAYVKEAKRRSQNDSRGSPTFYEYLKEIFDSENVRYTEE